MWFSNFYDCLISIMVSEIGKISVNVLSISGTVPGSFIGIWTHGKTNKRKIKLHNKYSFMHKNRAIYQIFFFQSVIFFTLRWSICSKNTWNVPKYLIFCIIYNKPSQNYFTNCCPEIIEFKVGRNRCDKNYLKEHLLSTYSWQSNNVTI